MNRILILLGAAALLLGCNNAAKREAAREQAYLDSVARAQAVQDSIAAARPLRKRGRRSAAPVAVTFTAENLPDEPVFDVVTTYGTFQIRLYQDTPLHRDNFVKLALSHYYDSLLVHRVVRDFVIQTGDPFTRDTARVDMYGQGGPDYTIPAEIIRDEEGKLVHRHKKGAVAAARRSDIANPMKESSGSQFYIVLEPENCLHLDGEYTVFGEVISGLAVLERIGTVKTDRYERPIKDIRVRRIYPDRELNKPKEEEKPAE
ncbi:MAG: peptidylprolyl isomerase [Bacteroidales bacterium]|nr:peptidylprolyl isomerase [Bacteroidales bacterium]